MANRASIFRITSTVILDHTILDADINAAANIARTKLNEDNDVRARNGAVVEAFNTGNTKKISLSHDGIDGIIDNDSGDIIIASTTGAVKAKKAGQPGELYAYGQGGINFARFRFDDSDLEILSQAGAINLRPQSEVNTNKNLIVSAGAYLRIYRTGDAHYGELKESGSDFQIVNSSGSITIQPATGNLSISKGGSNNTVRIKGASGGRYLYLTHDNTDGEVRTDYGDIKLNANGDINADNNTIKGIAALTYQAAVTRHKIFLPSDSVIEGLGGGGHAIGALEILRSADLTVHISNIGVSSALPDGATITNIKMYYYQTDAAAVCKVHLKRTDFQGNVITLNTLEDDDQTDGYNDKNVNVTSNNVLSNSYGFFMVWEVNPNDDANEVGIMAVDITYTITDPKA